MPLYPARSLAFSNVADFGANPNNAASANDSAFAAAIAALPASGGVIGVPNLGTYKISQSIIVDADNIALVGFGQRGSAPTIQIDSSADPTYALVIGNTKNVNSCCVSGLSFQGRSSTGSTGAGINFRCNGGSIQRTQVKFFGGTGINLVAFSGTIFELYLEDVDLVQNGMNISTPGDNLVIGTNVSDCEYHRVITAGDSGKTTTRHGVNMLGGGNHKFVDCHAYYCSGNGMYATGGNGVQIIGGEWETNGAKGLFFQNGGTLSNVTISSATCFGNTSDTDIVVDSASYFSITGCQCTSAGIKNIALYGASDGTVANNVAKGGSAAAIDLDSGSRYHVHDNVCNSSTNGIQIGATNCDVHDNLIEAGNLTEITGANTNTYHDNNLYGGGSITKIGSASVFRHNRGYNPVGQVTAPSFPATTVAATNTTGVDVTAFVANGTSAITVIQLAGAAGTYVTTGQQIAANGWGNIRIPAGGSVKFTYGGGTPTWTWFGD